jgi:hypothetical protein
MSTSNELVVSLLTAVMSQMQTNTAELHAKVVALEGLVAGLKAEIDYDDEDDGVEDVTEDGLESNGGGKNKTSVTPEHRCMARKWKSVNGDGQCSKKRTCGDFCTNHGKRRVNPEKKMTNMMRFEYLYHQGVPLVELELIKKNGHLLLRRHEQLLAEKPEQAWVHLGRVDEPPAPWRGHHANWLYTVGEYGPWTNTGGGIEWNLDLGKCGKINGTTWKVVAR